MIHAGSLKVLAVLAGLALPGVAAAACLPPDKVRSVVRSGKMITQVQAVNAARSVGPGEVIDARLCGEAGNYRYLVILLRQDGRVMRITVDAQSGNVIAVK